MCAQIIFDADNTLWNVNALYEQVRSQFADKIEGMGLAARPYAEKLAIEIDRKNYDRYALSTRRFPQSLVDTYHRLCAVQHMAPSPACDDEFRALGMQVFAALKAENYPGVSDTLQKLQEAGHTLYVWTQGDPAVQNRRLDDSGLRPLFTRVQIDELKTAGKLNHLLDSWGLDRKDTWVVGDSLNSDINPAVAANIQAVWIPQPVWNEDLALPCLPSDRVYLLPCFDDLPEVLINQPSAAPAGESEIVYLFVSAYHSLYRQYVLDILANPRDFTVRFPYRTVWLPGKYRTEDLTGVEADRAGEFCALLKNKRALIVFTDERVRGEPRRSPNFLPIRAATITRAERIGELVQVEFTLGDHVWYGKRDDTPLSPGADPAATAAGIYDAFCKKLPYRPRLPAAGCSYIALGPSYAAEIVTKSAEADDDAAWESVVRVLGALRSYKPFSCDYPNFPTIPNPFWYAMFYRLQPLKNLKSGNPVPIQPELGPAEGTGGDSGYLLESDSQYRLDLLFFSPRRPEDTVRQSRVVCKLSPDTALTPIGPTEIPLNFSYDHRSIDFATARSFQEANGGIAFSLSTPEIKDERTQPMTPAPLLLVKIKPNQTTFWIAGGLLFFGTLMGSLRDTLSQLLAPTGSPQAGSQPALSVLFGVVGSLLTTGAGYYLYRSLK